MKRSSEKGMALVITLLMLAIVTFMAVMFLAISRRERVNVKTSEDQMNSRALADRALAKAGAEMIARMVNVGETDLKNIQALLGTNAVHEVVANGRIQRARLHYSLIASRAYRNDNGFTSTGNIDVNNVNYFDASGNLLTYGSTRFIENVANLYYDPNAPVFVTDPVSKAQEHRYYLDLNRNGQFETNGTIHLNLDGTFAPKTTARIVQEATGDPEWIAVLENPEYPHSETNRIVGRFAYLVLPMGKSLDLNYIHNAAKYGTSGDPKDLRTGSYSRNQGVGSWELNLAGFLRDFNTNTWKPGTSWYSYTTNNAQGTAFNDARGILRWRLADSRTNLFTPYQALTNRTGIPPAPSAEGIRFGTALHDYVDMIGDGPHIPYEQWLTNAPIRQGVLVDNDDQSKLWHGQDRVDKTKEFFDIQKIFTLGTSVGSEWNAFYNRYFSAVTTNSQNSYDRYAYYRWIGQMGMDSLPALRGRIHLNFTNEPGTLSTNLHPWVSPAGPVYMPRAQTLMTNPVTGSVASAPVNTLTNFFLIAADAMLKASLVTNVYVDTVGRWRTNYTIGGTYFADPANNILGARTAGFWIPGVGPRRDAIANFPVRPDISITNIQIYHVPTNNTLLPALNRALTTMTNAEYSAAVHRILQLAANIYDNMTNRGKIEPFYPSVFRPIYTRTPTNVYISGWVNETNAFAATNHLWVTAQGLYRTNAFNPTNVNVYGQPWVIGAKKGWPNFNEFSIESYIQMTRKLEINKKDGLRDPSRWLTNQAFMIGVSNVYGIEAWNSYSAALPPEHPIRIEARVNASTAFEVVTDRGTRASRPTTLNQQFSMSQFDPVLKTPNYVVREWPGRKPTVTQLRYSVPPNTTAPDPVSDFRVPVYQMHTILTNSQVLTNAAGNIILLDEDHPALQPLNSTTELKLVSTNRMTYVAIDQLEGRIIDLVTIDRTDSIDIWPHLFSDTSNNNTADGGANPASGQNKAIAQTYDDRWWDTNLVKLASGSTNAVGLTVGVVNQILAAPPATTNALPTNAIVVSDWNSYSANAKTEKEYEKFQEFLSPQSQNPAISMQAPFSPPRRLYAHTVFQANDPLVHYTAADLGNMTTYETLTPGVPKQNDDLGQYNAKRYRPWGVGPQGDPFGTDSRYKDPAIGSSDAWEFPIAKLDGPGNYGITNFHYRFANLGDLGRVHRGTPWQTVYLKAAPAPHYLENQKANWAVWSGSWGTHPTNDWKLVGLFTTAITESASRGLLGVNQTNIAAWSAVLSGVQVITNTTPDQDFASDPYAQAHFGDLFIEPDSWQLKHIVTSINEYRANRPLGVFSYMGEILGTPALSTIVSINSQNQVPANSGLTFTRISPFLNPGRLPPPQPNYQVPRGTTDDVLEAIPRRILSLIKEDEPRVVVYAFGQTLKPAPRSMVTDPKYYNLCINYQVTGEYATKVVLRIDGELRNPNNPLRTVVESFEQLPPFE